MWSQPCVKRRDEKWILQASLHVLLWKSCTSPLGKKGIFDSKSLAAVCTPGVTLTRLAIAISRCFPRTLSRWIDSCHPHARGLSCILRQIPKASGEMQMNLLELFLSVTERCEYRRERERDQLLRYFTQSNYCGVSYTCCFVRLWILVCYSNG